MRSANTILNIHNDRGAKGLPLERVFKHLFNPEFYLAAYGKIYRNAGAMTKGTTDETVDGMTLQKINNIIELLQFERYCWTPVRRTAIPKKNGKLRPLGIPTWSDKLLQEVLRTLLEAYYEPRFSSHSHGFRPNRGCHTALLEIQRTWKGTVWFIEGDIKGCFDNVDHSILLEIIQRDIHDGRFVRLIEGLLEAGYMEDWRYYDTPSGTPQGGIISPLLANIYLNELDRFVEDTLCPAYNMGTERRKTREYRRVEAQVRRAFQRGDVEEAKRLIQERRQIPSRDPFDAEYRRLHYVRYADDFLLGFAGPRKEAEEIRDRLAEHLERKLKLTLSKEKTLITHATDEKAKFLGYEITVSKANSRISGKMRERSTNRCIALLMPRQVVQSIRERFSRNGKVIHRDGIINDSDYTIVQRYQSILRGLYNYYCMAVNVGNRSRMGNIKWILEVSLTKTLARKHQRSVSKIYRKYRKDILDRKVLQVVVERRDRKPLIACFGGFPFERNPKGLVSAEFRLHKLWNAAANLRTEVVQRLVNDKCELCGAEGPIHMHHIRKLADLDRPGRRPMARWQRIMSARKRKTLAVCEDCHQQIHAGTYDGCFIG